MLKLKLLLILKIVSLIFGWTKWCLLNPNRNKVIVHLTGPKDQTKTPCRINQKNKLKIKIKASCINLKHLLIKFQSTDSHRLKPEMQSAPR